MKLPNKDAIEVVTTDVATLRCVLMVIPHKLVVDKFHVIQYANTLWRMQENHSVALLQINSVNNLCMRVLSFLRTKKTNTTGTMEFANMVCHFTLKVAYNLKEGLRHVSVKPKSRLLNIIGSGNVHPKGYAPFLDIAKIIDNWSTEIFNYFDYFYQCLYRV